MNRNELNLGWAATSKLTARTRMFVWPLECWVRGALLRIYHPCWRQQTPARSKIYEQWIWWLKAQGGSKNKQNKICITKLITRRQVIISSGVKQAMVSFSRRKGRVLETNIARWRPWDYCSFYFTCLPK